MKNLLFVFVSLMAVASSTAQQTMGLFFNDSRSFNGYTLFSNNEMTYLIDNCGFIVNEWGSDFKTNNGLFISENGSLVRQGKIPGTVNIGGAGGIIERFSWEGNLEWSYRIADNDVLVHHDMEAMPNGNLLITVWRKVTESQAVELGRVVVGDFYSEEIWEIQPLPNNQASIVWKWSALDHVIQAAYPSKPNYGIIADHPELIDLNFATPDVNAMEDWLHINAIDYNAKLDQIIFGSRNTSEVYVIDHSTTTAEAASSIGGQYGKGGDILYRYGNPIAYDHGNDSDRILHQSHDVSWIKDGAYEDDFVIFNNMYIPNNRSRIQIWKNPSSDGYYSFSENDLYGPDQLLWTYDEVGFYSSRMSSVQVLPNGNILATEGTTGEISELTPNKEKVWRYINPVNKNGGPGIQGGTPQFNSLFKAVRYPDNFVGFEGRDMTPGLPIELSPDDIGCEIHETTSTKERVDNLPIIVNGNIIKWTSEAFPNRPFYIFDLLGRIQEKNHFSVNQREIDITHLSMGLYLLKVKDQEGMLFYKN